MLITSDGDIVNIGTGKGKMFLLGRQDLREEFYSFCWKGKAKKKRVFQVSALKKLGMVGWHNILFYRNI